MRLYFSRRVPEFRRVLLVESGSRYVFDNLLPGLREIYGDKLQPGLVTCFQGEPEGYPAGAPVWRVYDYPDAPARNRLLAELRARQYDVVGIICSGEPIMMKWKWWLAAKLPAKVFVMNENGDYFWLDYSYWKTMLHFVFFRAGLTGGDAVTTISRLVLFPFTVGYLVSFAVFVHLRRKLAPPRI